MLNKYLDIAPEVQKALAEGRPVVALESTIISHGMPYPQNVETALNVEKLIRENGATPATIAIIGGRLKAGLSPEEIDYLGKTGTKVAKASRRDLPVLVAEGRDGATTVTTTMIIAHMAGISVFATGGIGGVHRGAETTMDISADLEELAHTPVMVVCAGEMCIRDRTSGEDGAGSTHDVAGAHLGRDGSGQSLEGAHAAFMSAAVERQVSENLPHALSKAPDLDKAGLDGIPQAYRNQQKDQDIAGQVAVDVAYDGIQCAFK